MYLTCFTEGSGDATRYTIAPDEEETQSCIPKLHGQVDRNFSLVDKMRISKEKMTEIYVSPIQGLLSVLTCALSIGNSAGCNEGSLRQKNVEQHSIILRYQHLGCVMTGSPVVQMGLPSGRLGLSI